MFRDESCLNEIKSSCCYRCFRKDSCETSCDYLDNLETKTGLKTTCSSNEHMVDEVKTSASRGGDCPKCGGEMIEGTTSDYVRILKPGDLSGDLVSHCTAESVVSSSSTRNHRPKNHGGCRKNNKNRASRPSKRNLKKDPATARALEEDDKVDIEKWARALVSYCVFA